MLIVCLSQRASELESNMIISSADLSDVLQALNESVMTWRSRLIPRDIVCILKYFI